jgi:hypothetical protein
MRTPTPTATRPPGVGGTVRLPPVVAYPAPAAPAGDSGWTARANAALAGGLATVAVAIAAGAWCARRRWLR